MYFHEKKICIYAQYMLYKWIHVREFNGMELLELIFWLKHLHFRSSWCEFSHFLFHSFRHKFRIFHRLVRFCVKSVPYDRFSGKIENIFRYQFSHMSYPAPSTFSSPLALFLHIRVFLSRSGARISWQR